MALTQLTKVDGGGISTTSDYRVGVITASKFVGPFDGSGGNFSGVVTATNGVFSGNISAVDGTFSGNVSIAGTLTYEDVTNIDSVGIITAQSDVHVGAGLSVVGVSTFSGITTVTGNTLFAKQLNVSGVSTFANAAYFAGDTRITGSGNIIVGNASNNGYLSLNNPNPSYSKFYFNGSQTIIQSLNQFYVDCWDGNAYERFIHVNGPNAFTQLGGDIVGASRMPKIVLSGRANNTGTNSIKLFSSSGTSNNERFDLVDSGITITGLTTFVGNIDANGDLDVEGHTNLDNVSVAGVTTFSARIDTDRIVAETNTSSVPTVKITNSGIANQLELYGSATSTILIKATNNGGIPKLQLRDNYNRDNFISVTDSGDNLVLAVDEGNQGSGSTMQFRVDGTERVRINSTGKVGINTNNPLSGLHISDGTAYGSPQNPSRKATLTISAGSEGSSDIQLLSANYNHIFFGDSTDPNTGIIWYEHTGGGTDSMHFSTAGTEKLRIDSDGNITLKDTAAQGNSLVHFIKATDVNGASQYQLGMVSTGNEDLYLIQSRNANLRFQTSGATRWKIDGDPGHLLPETAGAVDIGSTSAEIGNVYLADDKKLQIGSSQDLQIYHTNSGTSWIRHTNSSEYFILEGNQMDFRDYATGVYRARMGTAVQLYYNGNNVKLATTNTGITVTGEVAATQDYPMVKPTLDCNFVLNKKLDPRIGYTRKGVASFYDEQGILKIVGDNVPRFDHNPETRESLGILIEEERTNNQPHSEQWSPEQQDGFLNVISGMDVDYDPGVVTPTGETTGAITFMETGASGQHYIAFDVFGATVSGTSYTFSFFFKNISGGGSGNANNVKVITTTAAFPYLIRTFYFDGPDAGTSTGSDTTLTKLPNGWWRGTFTATANNNFGSAAWTMDLRGLNGGAAYNNKIAIWGVQTETGEFPTSYIRTGNSDYGRTATRGVDFLQIQGQAFTDLYNPVESTILCSYQHTKEVATVNANLGGSRRVYRFGTGDTSSDTRIDFVSTSTFHPYISADGTNVATITATAPTRANVNTYATRVKENDFATTKAGGSIVSDTSGAWDPVNKMIEVQIGGTLSGASDAALQAHYKRFTYYPVGLPNSQLITISS